MPGERILPRMRKRFPLCTSPLSAAAPGLPVLRGVSGGGAALSPGFSLHLCSPEQIGAHFAAQSPERAFLAKPFFARAKNGVNSGRRSLKISVGEAKCYICRHKRVAALHLIRRLRRHLPLEGKAKSESCRAVRRLTLFAPNTETFFAVYNISVGCRSHPARSPGGLGGAEPH